MDITICDGGCWDIKEEGSTQTQRKAFLWDVRKFFLEPIKIEKWYMLRPRCRHGKTCVNPEHVSIFDPRKKEVVGCKARLLKKLDGKKGCWLFQGSKINGYGKMSINGVSTMAHRYFYELYAGPIPEGLVIDHLCNVRACCNPAHLQPVTAMENSRRGSRKPRPGPYRKWYNRMGGFGFSKFPDYPRRHYKV